MRRACFRVHVSFQLSGTTTEIPAGPRPTSILTSQHDAIPMCLMKIRIIVECSDLWLFLWFQSRDLCQGWLEVQHRCDMRQHVLCTLSYSPPIADQFRSCLALLSVALFKMVKFRLSSTLSIYILRNAVALLKTCNVHLKPLLTNLARGWSASTAIYSPGSAASNNFQSMGSSLTRHSPNILLSYSMGRWKGGKSCLSWLNWRSIAILRISSLTTTLSLPNIISVSLPLHQHLRYKLEEKWKHHVI